MKCTVGTIVCMLFTMFLFLGAVPVAAETAEENNACVACHKNPDFMVKNKKLYNYYNEWELSIHHQDGVLCHDCHGGDPLGKDKDQSHASMKAMTFDQIPQTCGKCHQDTLSGYQQSTHFKMLMKDDMGHPGPNCITCHNSISSVALNVSTVSAVCSQCHIPGMKEDVPRRAQVLLNHLYSVSSFYRYISTKGDPMETRSFLNEINADRAKLATTWHTFDLNQIEMETKDILGKLKIKREEMLKK